VVLVYPPPPAADGIQITREDLGRLDPNEFLNDSIIDFYIKYAKEHVNIQVMY
jgi:Ulp1 family protease